MTDPNAPVRPTIIDLEIAIDQTRGPIDASVRHVEPKGGVATVAPARCPAPSSHSEPPHKEMWLTKLPRFNPQAERLTSAAKPRRTRRKQPNITSASSARCGHTEASARRFCGTTNHESANRTRRTADASA